MLNGKDGGDEEMITSSCAKTRILLSKIQQNIQGCIVYGHNME